MRFYTEFANPSKTVYSWNRALSPSRTAFGKGDVGLYMGFASEYALLSNQNPNLDFIVSMVPQIESVNRAAITFGRMYAFAVPRGSKNTAGAMSTALILAGRDSSRFLWAATGLASPRRDVLEESTSNVVQSIVRDSAIIAHAWLDPDPIRTDVSFGGMIEDTVSGSSRVSESVQRAEREIANLLTP